MMVVLLVAGIGLLLAGLVGDRVRIPDQRIQSRQYPDHRRYGRRLHRDAAARPLEIAVSCRNRAAAWRGRVGGAYRDATGAALPPVQRRVGHGDSGLASSAEPTPSGELLAPRRRRRHGRPHGRRTRLIAASARAPNPRRQAEAQPVVLVVIPQGARARPGADQRALDARCSRPRPAAAAAGSRSHAEAPPALVRRRLAETGTRAARLPPPRAPAGRRRPSPKRRRRGSLSAGRAQ